MKKEREFELLDFAIVIYTNRASKNNTPSTNEMDIYLFPSIQPTFIL